MNEYIVFAILAAVIVIGLFIKGMHDERVTRKRFLIKIREDYGKLPNKTYVEGRLNVLAGTQKGAFSKAGDSFNESSSMSIDETTWNDLDMDRVFGRIDYTFSAAGEESLYRMIRNPELDETNLLQREEKIRFFAEHEEERIKLQMQFATIGRTGKHSIVDYLEYLNNLKPETLLKHRVMIVLLIAALVTMIFNFGIGLLLFLILLVFNIIWYFPSQKRIAPYITTFAYLLKLIKSVDKIAGFKISIYEDEINRLKELKRGMSKFFKNSSIIFGSMALKSNPLDIIMDYLKMGLHIDILKFYSMLKEAKLHKNEFIEMFYLIGDLEAFISIASYRASLDYYAVPEFSLEKAMQAEELYHPLINKPVSNSFYQKRGMLLTGSNASGKSTFLKTVAINALLAQSIHTCLAKSYKADMFRIYSSMSLRDDLENNESYFIVEIKMLKRVIDAVSLKDLEARPVLCFVDEVLRGTNTIERIAASTEILKKLAAGNCVCFAATHDIELTSLLSQQYDNYHFEEMIVGNDVKFNYLLKEGSASTRNAIKLLSVMGYDTGLVEAAEKKAQEFMQLGKW